MAENRCIFLFHLSLGLFIAFNPALVHAQTWNGYQGHPAAVPAIPNVPILPNNLPVLNLDEPLTGVFLLRTGFLLQGTATNDGKRYVLKTDFGSMRIPVANVEFIGKTPYDVFLYKKAFANPNNGSDLMKLGDWCFKNGMKNEGIAVYRQAQTCVTNDALRDVIQRRLNEELNQAKTNAAGDILREQTTLKKEETLLKNIPNSVANSFAQRVQPALVNRCAAADCHGSNGPNAFKLGIPQQTHGTIMQKNLYAVLPWIDLDYPSESKLLTALISNHGGRKAAFSVESPQYNNIVQWIQLAAKELPMEQRLQISNQRKPRDTVQEEVLMADYLPKGFQDIKPQDISPQVVSGGVSPVGESLDPFDPEIFNAAHHPTVRREIRK